MDCFVIKSYLQTGLLLHTEDPCAASAEPSQPVQYDQHRRQKKQAQGLFFQSISILMRCLPFQRNNQLRFSPRDATTVNQIAGCCSESNQA